MTILSLVFARENSMVATYHAVILRPVSPSNLIGSRLRSNWLVDKFHHSWCRYVPVTFLLNNYVGVMTALGFVLLQTFNEEYHLNYIGSIVKAMLRYFPMICDFVLKLRWF